LLLRAQAFTGPRPRNAHAMLRAVGVVQLDTISVLARSHELVAYARLGPVARKRVEAAYWSRPAGAFEYWGHQASVIPIEWWPLFAFRRRRRRAAKTRWGFDSSTKLRTEMIARVRDLGPSTMRELGGATQGGTWWDWSPAKVAAELLLDEGVFACVERTAWRRVYDLAERAIPSEHLHDDLDDAQCAGALVEHAVQRLGVATPTDLANYFMLKPHDLKAGLATAALEPVTVAGWPKAFVAPGALDAPVPPARTRPTLISPFDSLIWDRRRVARVFGLDYKVEIFVPQAQRKFGYYGMPLLAGGRLVGLVDPKRDGRTLIARRVALDNADAIPALAAALKDAAAWVGCDTVAVEVVDPPELAASVRSVVAAV
jgi:uncharacterized protein YcaQ